METTRQPRQRAVAFVGVVVVAVGAGVVAAWPRAPNVSAAVSGRATDAGAVDSFAGGRAWLDGQKLDLNTVDARTLARISGIGPALAQKIVDERARRGRFTDVDELDEVDGIGPKLLAKLSALVEVR